MVSSSQTMTNVASAQPGPPNSGIPIPPEYEQRVQRYFQQKTGDLDCHDHFRTCHGIIQGIVDKEIQGCRQGKSQNAKVIRRFFRYFRRGIGNCKKRLGKT